MPQPEIWTPPAVEHHHPGPCECEPTIAYIRVSMVGERDPESLKSPDIQLESCIADAVRKNKRIVKVVPDINRTGRTFRKRSVDGVIDDIRSGLAKSVTLWKWSRWGRNVEFSRVYLGKVKQAGGRVDSATEDFDQSTAIGRFSQGMVMQFDEFQSDMIGEGWQAAHKKRRDAGLPHSGRKRFGYDYIDQRAMKAGSPHPESEECAECRERKPHYVLNPVEAPELRRLYDQYVAGESLRQLVKILNETGFRTSLAGLWTPQSLGQMLDTGFGAGLIRERSAELLAQRKASGKSVRNNLASYDIWRNGVQPTVIEANTWERYRRRREDQGNLPPRARNAVHALGALLYCELCSRRLTTKYSGRKREHSWVCWYRASFHPDTHVSISNAAALQIVREWLAKNADPKTGESIDEIASRLHNTANMSVRTTAQVEAEIDAEQTAITRLYGLFARGKMSEDQLDNTKAAFEENLDRLRAELGALAMTALGAEGRPGYEAFRSLDETWDEALSGEPGLLNAPLREVISFVVVSPAAGRGRWADSSWRVEVVGSWEESSKRDWLEARRRKFAA